MIGQGSERPDKGKGVARPKKRQRQAPKYVLRVPAKLPTTTAPSPSSVGPPPTLTIQPPTPTVDPTPTSAIHSYPTSTAHPSPTPTADPLPPPVVITPTPPLMLITPTHPPDPTFIPSSSCIPSSETVTPSADPDSTGDGEGLDPVLHDRPWIEPYGKRKNFLRDFHRLDLSMGQLLHRMVRAMKKTTSLGHSTRSTSLVGRKRDECTVQDNLLQTIQHREERKISIRDKRDLLGPLPGKRGGHNGQLKFDSYGRGQWKLATWQPYSHPIRVLDWGNFSALRREVVQVLAVQRLGNGGAMSSGSGPTRKEGDDGCGGHRGSRRRLTRVDGGLVMKVFAILGFGLLQVQVAGNGGVRGCSHGNGGAVMARRE
ncbi:hypothetical protein LR48_Vigan07g171700 [Vigna angularis]|uniref:Uncharacterized protein n=1 Tax=Phaseolus angularis TaxID=3914 RepID=A0A0L9UZ24_PHAAN|nr:hypothetical protein LR48_Vigan07g171700 [Vigna angularis]